MSGLAALISIFRLAVGVQGSTRVDCLMGVMWARSGVAPSLPMSKTGTGSVDFSGVDLLHSVQMFSWVTTSDLWLHSCYDFKRLVRLGEYQGLKNENDGAKEDIMKHFTTCNVVEIFYFTSAAV